ncbi:hypothetical protein MTR72_18150, partial [Bradyrhizobium sp. ISRA442]
MLRWMVPALVAMLTVSSAGAADLAATPRRRAVAPPPPKVYVETDPDALISPAYGIGSYVRNLPGTPLLPGSNTLPGYYGRPWDYDYQGAYYGGPQVGYFWRLPYACGVYGY